MKVSRYNYSQQFSGELDALVIDIRQMLEEGRYVLGRDVEEFEAEFARFLGVPFAVGVNSGTDALILSLMALDIGPGDEVITQANTFYATVAAIRFVGAKPVLVDASEGCYLMDDSNIESLITRNTKAIIPVHLFGKPMNMSIIMKLAKRHDLYVVEDAAQSHGASIAGQKAGTAGALGCFSFHPSKNLAAAGDAGIIVTSNKTLHSKLKMLRGLGQRSQNDHVLLGLNSKLSAIQARILLKKLNYLEDWNRCRRSVAARYREKLEDMPLKFQDWSPDNEVHVFHLFQIQTPLRDQLLTFLKEQEIDAVVRYPVPIHQQPAFADMGWQSGQFPVAERLASECLCLPIRPDMSGYEIEYVCTVIRRFFNKYG